MTDSNDHGDGFDPLRAELDRHLADRFRAAQAVVDQMNEAEALGRPVWGFTTDTDAAGELLEARDAVLEFRPVVLWLPPK